MKIFLVMIFAIFLVGCGGDSVAENRPAESDGLRVVTTIFPQYDFVRYIAGGRVQLDMLLSPGAESHGFEPTPRDMITINNADLLIYVGGHNDEWVAPILTSLERDDMRTAVLLDMVDVVETEHYHHHEHDHEHHDHDDHHHDHDHHHHDHDHHHDDHSHDHGHHHHDHSHHHHHHYDEHVWTCPRNAIIIVQELTEILSEMDSENASFFRENSARLIESLREIDSEIVNLVATAERNTVVFGDRFPLRYFVDTYGLIHYAAFTGCSAETQASPATIAYLINKVQDENIPVVFYIEFSNRLIANVIAEATGATLLEFHSAHNVSQADFNAGVTYVDLMRRNIEALREALN